MGVDKLLSDHGLDGEQTLAWAKAKADALVAELDDPQLRSLLAGEAVDIAPARADEAKPAASPANLPPTPAQARQAETAAAQSADTGSEDLEELDVEELEELDMEEVEMVEEVDEAEMAPEAPEAQGADEAADSSTSDFDPSAGDSNEEIPVRTGDTDTGMDRQAVLDAAPDEVEDAGSGDLFDEDELDIDIDI